MTSAWLAASIAAEPDGSFHVSTAGDVATVLADMLRALERAKHPDAEGDRIAHRGFGKSAGGRAPQEPG